MIVGPKDPDLRWDIREDVEHPPEKDNHIRAICSYLSAPPRPILRKIQVPHTFVLTRIAAAVIKDGNVMAQLRQASGDPDKCRLTPADLLVLYAQPWGEW